MRAPAAHGTVTAGSRVTDRPALIYDDEHLQVLHLEGASDYTVVSFNEMGTRAGAARFWGDRLFAKNRIRAYGFVTTRPNWFPLRSATAAVDAVLAHDSERRPRVLYGHSMGGFAALKLSRALDATAALAFCPQVTIAPSEMPFPDTRYREHYRPKLHDGMRVGREDLAGAIAVIYDPNYQLDLLHAQLFAESAEGAVGAWRAIRMPYTGHEAVRLLASSTAATDAFEAASRGDLVTVREVLAKRRKTSSVYLRNLALAAFRSKRYSTAQRLAERAIEATPDDPRSFHLLSRCHEVQGDLDVAVRVARHGLELSNGKANMAEHLARLLCDRARGDLDEAASLLPRTLDAGLPKGRPQRIFSEVQLRRGQLSHALELAQAAHRESPEHAGHRRWLESTRALIIGRELDVESAGERRSSVREWIKRRMG